MLRRRILSLFLSAASIGAVLLGEPNRAEANLQLQLGIDGGALVTVDTDVSGGSVGFDDANYGSIFKIQALAGSSNSPGSSPQAELNIPTLRITNNTGATHTLTVLVGDAGFTFPPTSPSLVLSSGIGGSVTTNTGVNAISYQTWVSSSNVQNATSGPLTSGLLSQSLALVANGQPIPALGSILTGSATAPFSLTGIVKVTLGAGGALNFSSSAVLTNVPEPGSIAMAIAGLPVLGLFWARRRARA